MSDIIVIDKDLRTMQIPSTLKLLGVESDDSVNRINFCLPKEYNGFDLSEFVIRINYMNANNEGDVYLVDDTSIQDNNIYFSWLVGRHACEYKGNVKFIVCLKKVDGNAVVTQEFNTTVHKLPVLEGLETSEAVIQENPDIFEQLLLQINTVLDNLDDQIVPAVDDWLEDHPEATTTVQDSSITVDKLASDTLALINSSSITADLKDALIGFANAVLQLATKVAYIDGNGQSYYDDVDDAADDLYDALYPPANLLSISAVYTQSGTVYNTDSLDDLKSDLVVTGHYDDLSTSTVPSNDYTLSGTLTVGTSTITVNYGEKTTTFDVTVSQGARTYLYNWNFKQSLVDSVANKEVSLECKSSATLPTRDSDGLHFNAAKQIAYFGAINPVGKTIEIDVASFNFAGNSSNHVRFLMNSNGHDASLNNIYGNGSLIFRNTGVWAAYGYNTTSGITNRGWSDYTGLSNVNMFDGKTVKVEYDSDGHTKRVYVDGVLVGTDSTIYFNRSASYMYIGGILSSTSPSASTGDQCYNMTITGVRIYENE